MNSCFFGLAAALAVAVISGAMAQTAAAPDPLPANPVERQVRGSRSDLVDQVPELRGSEQLATFIAQPGTHDVGLVFRMLSMTSGKIAIQPGILQALDFAWKD